MNDFFLHNPTKKIKDEIIFRHLNSLCIINLPLTNNFDNISDYSFIMNNQKLELITDNSNIKCTKFIEGTGNSTPRGSYIKLKNNEVLLTSKDNFTIGCWIKPSKFSLDRDSHALKMIPLSYYCTNGDSKSVWNKDSVHSLLICKEGKFYQEPRIRYWYTESESNFIDIDESFLPELNKWSYVSISKKTILDECTLTYRIIKDNILFKKEIVTSKYYLPYSNDMFLIIGAEWSWYDCAYEGYMRNYRLFNTYIDDEFVLRFAKYDCNLLF